MSHFGLPDPNNNVYEEGIEWNSISKWERQRSYSVLEMRLHDK